MNWKIRFVTPRSSFLPGSVYDEYDFYFLGRGLSSFLSSIRETLSPFLEFICIVTEGAKNKIEAKIKLN